MKKKNLHGLSLNKKSIANFSTVVGGDRVYPAPTNYNGCPNTNAACVSGLCATGVQCELDSFLCTNYQCLTHDQCPLPTTVFPIC